MGAWGIDPWENDGAAGWFYSLFSQSGIASCVEATLRLEPLEHHEEIRAASFVVAALGRPFVWPIEQLPSILARAVDSLTAVVECGALGDNPDATSRVREEMAGLQSGLSELASGAQGLHSED